MGLSVAIDAFRLVAEPLTSGAVYASELARSLSILPEIERIYLLVPRKPGSDFIYADLLGLEKIEFVWPINEVFPERNFRSQSYWIQWVILHLVRTQLRSIDYYIAPYHHPPVLLRRKTNVITVIHDLCGLRTDCGYAKSKKAFYEHLFMLIIAWIGSGLLIPISKYTQEQLKKTFPFFGSRISNVVYNGVSARTVDSSVLTKILRKYDLTQKDYFLGFGTPGLRKGFDLTLGAYKLYRDLGGKTWLVLIIQGQQRGVLNDLIQTQDLRDVIVVADIDAIERDALYKGAQALLFPSRCEGFGYPLVEAMRQGCPPIAYQEGAASEIIGSILPLLKKLDIREIVEYMVALKSLDSAKRSDLAGHLIDRSLLFTTNNFGRDFLEAMKTVR
jgi:glycosyltransferase involved in cell wall biosynthesis